MAESRKGELYSYVERETGRHFEIILRCKCGWAICKDAVTKNWTECRMCGEELVTRKAYRD